MLANRRTGATHGEMYAKTFLFKYLLLIENDTHMIPEIETSSLVIFVSTFFFVSATPGMCMTLSMTLGMTLGVRRTFWMMWGELLGVGLVCVAAVVGVASIMLNYPAVFQIFKYVGGAYLLYLGIQLWLSKGKMAITVNSADIQDVSRRGLALQGFVTAIANPKGWAFMISLLPPFINPQYPLTPQMMTMLTVILVIEFCCMFIYASGGKTLRYLLNQKSNVRLLNRVAGCLMMVVGVWLAVG